MTKKRRDIRVTKGTDNVFADLEVEEAAEALAKAELAARIATIISKRKLTQAGAAKLFGVDQPKVSALVRGRLTEFSVERLMRFLTNLGQDVEIVLKRRLPAGQPGRIRVTKLSA